MFGCFDRAYPARDWRAVHEARLLGGVNIRIAVITMTLRDS